MIIEITIHEKGKTYATGAKSEDFENQDQFEATCTAMFASAKLTIKKLQQNDTPQA